MKKVIRYEHRCKRCQNTFVSKTKTPIACGKCKSAYWDVKPPSKPVQGHRSSLSAVINGPQEKYSVPRGPDFSGAKSL